MPEWTSEAKIAAGYNNAGSLALVTSLATTPAIPFLEVQTLKGNRRGVPRVATSGVPRRSGSKSTQWVSSLLWVVQFTYLVANYEGKVTIRTTLNNVTWANYNAILDCRDMADYEVVPETGYGQALDNFIWYFTRLEAI